MTEELFGAYGITFRWKANQPNLLDEVSFELSKGEILALLGPNGSGKTTLLKAVAGLISLRRAGGSGVVRFRGTDFLSMDTGARARSVAYVPAEIRAEFPMTAEQAVTLGRLCHGGSFGGILERDREIVRRAMEMTFCWGLRGRDLHSLSGGERQLVAIARAIAQGSEVLLLDEAVSRMDLNHQGAIAKLLRKLTHEGKSVILVSHDLNFAAEWSDRCLLLQKGRRLAVGPVSEVISEANLRKLYPGAEIGVRPSPLSGHPQIFFSG